MLFNNSLDSQLKHWDETIRKQPQNYNGYVRRGMVKFQLGKVEESIEDFDRAEELEPRVKPYLWQRGLSYYYVGRFAEGVQQFEIDLTVNSQDVEETVWRYLCMARLSGEVTARQNLLTVKNDPRRIMAFIYNLFAGNSTPEDLLAIGAAEGIKGKFYSHLYLGLYYESQENFNLAQGYITQAADKYKLDDYMWYLSVVHKQMRGWV